MNKLERKLLIGITFFVCILILVKCNPKLDFNNGVQVSKNIKASKEKNVFISKYRIENVKIYNKNYVFPISEVWAEKKWSMSLDSSGKEVLEIKSTAGPTLVFLLNKNDSLKENNYLNKWIISDIDSSVGGVTDGIINLELKKNILPDNYQLTIYLLKTSYDYKNNLERIADFILKQKPQ